jgi:la-related protein 1
MRSATTTPELDLQQQLEYYFSAQNLAKDEFLRSKMNSDGYVSTALVAGFKRVQVGLFVC